MRDYTLIYLLLVAVVQGAFAPVGLAGSAVDERPEVMFWTGMSCERLWSIPRPYDILGRETSNRPGPLHGFELPSCALADSSKPARPSLSVAARDPGTSRVKIVDKGTHYEVMLDFSGGASRFAVGAEYGAKIQQMVPDFEELLDSYLKEGCFNGFIYHILLRRVRQMKPQIPKEYRDEIDGLASQLSGGKRCRRGDGKISVDELYLLNLLGDVCRLSSCCAVTVYGERSATCHPLVARNFDWPDGKQNQIARLHAVIHLKTDQGAVTSIACLGFQAICTGVNWQGVFAGVLDSATGAKFSARKRRSYLFDLRQALERFSSVNGVVATMTDPRSRYSFNHSVILADRDKAGVLENNFSGHGKHMCRALRTAESELNPGVTWDVPYAVGAVNWFTLRGNDDNRIDPLDKVRLKKGQNAPDKNTRRWENMREQLKILGEKVDLDSLKKIISFRQNGGSMYKGDLYNYFTMQMVVFDPLTLAMEVAFRPRNGARALKPAFQRIDMPMEHGTATDTAGVIQN